MNSIWPIALLIPFASVCRASDNPARQLLIAADQQSSLSYNQTSAFELEVNFVAQMNSAVRGHLTLKWAAKDRWWRKIVMGDFRQTDVRSGDQHYTTRNLPFTPIPIRELITLLVFAEGSEFLVVKKQRQRTQNGVEVVCLQVGDREVKRKPHEVCLNPVSHEILSDEWHESPNEIRRETYADYFDFGDHRYPRRLELLVNGGELISANVETLTTAAFDPSLLVPPKGAIERRQCDDLRHATPMKTPDPMYPKSAAKNQLDGDTTVAMTVLTDGSVSDIQLIGSSARSMDEAALQTLRTWKFRPAMCGAEPVVSDIEVVVSFRRR